MIHYRYTHMETEATTGYFACIPEPQLSLKEVLIYLEDHPLDSFMRRNALSILAQQGFEDATQQCDVLYSDVLPETIYSFLLECAIIIPELKDQVTAYLGKKKCVQKSCDTKPATPFIYLAWEKCSDREIHSAWNVFFSNNIERHKALLDPGSVKLPPLYLQIGQTELELHGKKAPFVAPIDFPLSQALATFSFKAGNYTPPEAADTAALAENRLEECGIIAGQEMRHISSLSPIGLLRPWRVDLKVQCEGHSYTLEGQAMTYGRGLSLGAARASCLMEMVERASLYVTVKNDQVTDRLEETNLFWGTRFELLEKGYTVLDPNNFPLEVPYNDSRLAWISGHTALSEPCLVPLQMATLFSNMDEMDLFDSLSSTGIATGNTLEEAKLAALTEIIERHSEATTPFVKNSCFTLTSSDPFVGKLLDDYKARGIQVQFQDITGALGVPVFKCFVMSRKGAVSRGHGAHLNARRAIISALTETPFPYPQGGPSGPRLRNLPECALEKMPDYAQSSPAASLALLEETLVKNNRMPTYVVLTHKKLLFPVVRAFIPGFELAADRDQFSRVPYTLYANYLKLFRC